MEEKDRQRQPLADFTNNKPQEGAKRKNLTSLPDLLKIKQPEIDHGCYRNSSLFSFQPQSLINIQNEALGGLNQEILNRNVYSFLETCIQNQTSYQTLLQNFKEYEKDVKISVRKQRKIVRDSNKVIQPHSLENLSGKESREMKEAKQEKKLRFIDILQDEIYSAISIKMIHSNIRLSKKEVTSIRETALSIGRLFSFRQSASGDQKLNSMRSHIKDMIIQDEEDQSNGDEDSSPGVSWGKIECSYKYPSLIILQDEEDDARSQFFSSNETLLSFQGILKPNIPLSISILKKIFWNCSPFLINLSICLMLKCLTKFKLQLTNENICWLLTTATIVSYKIFYDEQIQGLTSHYAKLLQMKNKDLVSLQIWFLHELNYQIYVTNRQYFEIMSKLLKLA